MKQLAWIGAAVMAVLLAGCWTAYETPQAELNQANHFDMNLKLEGFTLESLQQTGFTTGTASATAYNWRTNDTVSASGSSMSANYEYRPDNVFANSVTDVFENLGFNIRSDSPELVIAGRIGRGGFPWNSWQLWVRDAPLFLIAIPTFGMVISCPRINDAELIVYDCSGKRLANYYAEQGYYALSFAFPFANFANEKAYEWYGDRKAAQFAMIDCLNQFLADLHNGKFNQAIATAKEHYASHK